MNLPVRVQGAARVGCWILAGSAGVLACRLATTPIVPAVENRVWSDASATSTQPASAPPTLVHTATALRPTFTPTPVYGPVEVEAGRVENPPELQLVFHIPFEDLTSGWVVLYDDKVSGDLMYRHLETHETGSLLSVLSPAEESARGLFAYSWWQQAKTRLLGWLGDPITRYATDLWNQDVVRLGEMCNEGASWFSPSGRKLATLCDREKSSDGEVSWLDIDLFDEPKRLRFQMPVARYWDGPDTVHWVSDNALMLLAEHEGVPCLLVLDPYSLTCDASVGEAEDLKVSPSGKYFMLTGPPSVYEGSSFCDTEPERCLTPWRLYDMACLREGVACVPIAQTAHEELRYASLYWSPDGASIAVMRGFADWTQIGIIDVERMQYRRLVELPAFFGFVDWCPDSKCFLVAPGSNQPYAKSYFIYLDGHQEALDIADPMAILEIP